MSSYRYRDTVGASAIRDFRGAMVGRTDKGLFITTGRFISDAKREATRDGAPPIELIDGERALRIDEAIAYWRSYRDDRASRGSVRNHQLYLD